MQSETERIYRYQPLWDKWQIDDLIGEGSFGKVYKISHEEYGQTYVSAVKMISIPTEAQYKKARSVIGADDRTLRNYFHEMVQSLINEVNILYSLSGNSNILGYHDHKIIEHEDKVGWDILIRMEYVMPLSKYLAEKRLTMGEIISLGIDICTALDICLKHDIIHRDIKDENIFFNDDGIFKLGDFGIATKLFPVGGWNSSMGGTPNYMAPEVYRGEKYDAAVDIYSLGMVMYRLLNHGRFPYFPPYPAPIRIVDKEVALAKRMSGMHLSIPDQAGIALGKIIVKACAFKAENRYASPMTMKRSLENVFRSLPIAARDKAVTLITDSTKKDIADIVIDEVQTHL
ncbi:MAG: serine/threonine protein kinase [Saccharofermentanales bacterium]